MKIDGHFRFPHPQIILKQFSNICKKIEKMYFIFLLNRVVEKLLRNFAKQLNFKKIKKLSVLCDILQLPHTVISNSENLTQLFVQ